MFLYKLFSALRVINSTSGQPVEVVATLGTKFRKEILHSSTLMLPGKYICVFKQISDRINSIQISKMFCGECSVSLIITF